MYYFPSSQFSWSAEHHSCFIYSVPLHTTLFVLFSKLMHSMKCSFYWDICSCYSLWRHEEVIKAVTCFTSQTTLQVHSFKRFIYKTLLLHRDSVITFSVRVSLYRTVLAPGKRFSLHARVQVNARLSNYSAVSSKCWCETFGNSCAGDEIKFNAWPLTIIVSGLNRDCIRLQH